jgi:cytochrome c oxidase subunit II
MINALIYLTIILAVVLIARLVRVYELSNELRGAKSEVITAEDNRTQGGLMLAFIIAFFAAVIYMVVAWKDLLLPISASEHGVDIDKLMNFNLLIIFIVFFITNGLLFFFAFKYYFRKNNRATFFAHSNKLEFIWTSIPTVVLAVIIIYGLMTWNEIMGAPSEEAVNIELYSKQFDWTARYPGNDNQYGQSNYLFIEGGNDLGLDTLDQASWDDVIVKGEFVIPVNKEVNFQFRSRDVIHSAYMPHFRAQMNCVPGMVTNFHFKPTITSKEMKEIVGDEEFEYVVLCNKICGAAHWNMQINIIVVSEEEYKTWLAEQKVFKADKLAELNSTSNVNNKDLAVIK